MTGRLLACLWCCSDMVVETGETGGDEATVYKVISQLKTKPKKKQGEKK
jgi:hypothetical protein